MANTEQLSKLLLKLHLPSDVIDDLITGNENVNVDEIYSRIKEKQKELFLNDSQTIGGIKGEVKLEELKKVSKKIARTFGIPEEEIDKQKVDELLDYARHKQETDLRKKFNEEGGTKLHADLNEAQEKITQLRNEIRNFREVVIPEKEKELDRYKNDFTNEYRLRERLDKFNTNLSPDALKEGFFPYLKNQIYSKYTLVDNEGELELRTREGNHKPTNDDGSDFLSVDELITKHLRKMQLLVESNANSNRDIIDSANNNARNQRTENRDQFVAKGSSGTRLAGLNKAEEHLKNMKK